MADLFTLENLFTLLMLILLQAVLGFDNLLYLSLESKRAPKEKQKMVRQTGIIMAIGLRIGLLILLVNLVDYFKPPIATIEWGNILSMKPTIHSIIEFAGGAFIIYTAIKEIWHMINLKDLGHEDENKGTSVVKVIALIVVMNLVFSFDSILSAMALSNNIIIMSTAIVIGGILMIYMAEKVTTFLQKNRMYEVLGLFILFVVGIMLVTEGGHKANLVLFGSHITAMSKTTFYFVIFVLVLTDLVQSRYQRKLSRKK